MNVKNVVKHLIPSHIRISIRGFLLQLRYRLFHIRRKLFRKITIREQIRLQDDERNIVWKKVLDEIERTGYKDTYEKNILKMEEELHLLIPQYTKEVLDIGCCYGKEIDWFQKNNFRYVGLDIYFPDLQKLKGKGESAVCGAVESLPFKKDKFDVAYAVDILEHSSNIKLTLKEIKRILKAGGVLVFKVPICWDDDPSHMIHLGQKQWENLLNKRLGKLTKSKKLDYMVPKSIVGCVTVAK